MVLAPGWFVNILSLVQNAWAEPFLPTIGTIGPWFDPSGIIPCLIGIAMVPAAMIVSIVLTMRTRRAIVWTPTILLALGIADLVRPEWRIGWALLLILWLVIAWPHKPRPESREPKHSLARAALLIGLAFGITLVVSVGLLFVLLIFFLATAA